MKIENYGSIKLVAFSNDITTEELSDAVEAMKAWAEENKDIAIITHIPRGGKSVQDLSSISRMFNVLKGSKLKIYGVRTGPIASFIAKVVGQLLSLSMIEADDFPKLVQRIKKDNPDFARDADAYNIMEKLQELK